MSFSKYIETAIVLDTNPGFRTDVSSLLKNAGIEVLRPTQNGKLGYQEIAKARVRCDLVIVNMELEDINAIQFMSALRKNSRLKSTHVIIGLTDDLMQNIEGALNFGLSGFFTKPISLEDLAGYLDQQFEVCAAYDGNELSLYNLSAADFYYAQKEYKNALSHLEENLKLGDSAKIWYEVGRCKAHLEDKGGASEAFIKAVELDKEFAELVRNFTESHTYADDLSEKSDVAEQAIELFGIPSEQISGGFYDQHKLRQAVICSTSFDDNTILRNMLIDMGLKDVKVHSRGKDALYDVKTKPIDLIVTAIQLDDMNGLQLIDVVRRDPDYGQQTKILLWLDEDLTGNLLKAYQVGLDGFLLKPYSSDSLRDALHKMMIDDAMLSATKPQARQLTKASLGLFRLGAYEQGEALAEAAIQQDQDAGMPALALAMNLHAQGSQQEAEDKYVLVVQLNSHLEPACKQMRQKIQQMLDNDVSEEIQVSMSQHEVEDISVDFDKEIDLHRTADDLNLNNGPEISENRPETFPDPDLKTEPSPLLEEPDVGLERIEHHDSYETQEHQFRRKQTVPVFEREGDVPEPDFDVDIVLKKSVDVDVNGELTLEGGGLDIPRKAASFPAVTKKAAKHQQQESEFANAARAALPVCDKKQVAKQIREDSQTYKEQIFTAAARRRSQTKSPRNEVIVRLDSGAPEVTTWMSPEILRQLPMPSQDLLVQEGKSGQLDVYGKSFKKVIEQARLFNGRIHCIGAEEQPEELTDYLAKVGKVMKDEQTSGRIHIDDKKLAGKINKIAKKLHKNPDDLTLAAEMGKIFMESGAVDTVYERVHAHWDMNENLKVGRLGDAVRSAVKSGLGEALLKDVLKTANAAKLLDHIVNSRGGVRLLEESISTGGGLHFLERYSDSEGGIKFLEREIKEGRGVRFLENVISEGKGIRFLHELIEGGGAAAVLEASLQSSGAVRILGNVLEDGGGVKWLNDDVRPFSAAVLELHDPIVKLHAKFWQGRERSEELLDAALKNLGRKDVKVDHEDFDEVLASDNYSLETFKKIFQKLKESGHQQLTDDFYKLNAPRYYEAPDVTSALGNNLLQLGETDRALTAFEKALKEDKNNYGYLKNMAVAALKEKKYREAEKWCNKMLRSQPRNAEAYNLLGINCKKQAKYKQSIRYYIKGIKVDPESVKLYHNLAIAYAQIGQDERSKKMFRKAKQIQKARAALNSVFDDFKRAG